MIYSCKYIAIIILFAAGAQTVHGQHIGFKLQGSEGLQIFHETGELDFNEVSASGLPFYLAGDEGATIDLTDNRSEIAIFRIEAPAHLDIHVDVSATAFSLICASNCPNPIPELEFQLGWAYWNRTEEGNGELMPDIEQLAPEAREVLSATGTPLNFGSATFPMRLRKTSAPASPPPTPGYDGYTNVASTSAFILVYGRLSDIPENFQAGSYEATITVTASLPTYN